MIPESKNNHLFNEASPYLLQHAHNPVNWYPWGDAALEKATQENKLIIISIGYSACHWCHVMERETFMDEESAALMNRHFISIKIDREERPDLDQVYMQAVQMIWGQGGWPLNVFALPDGRPFYGGTYFPREQWKETLTKINEIFQSRPDDIIQQAEEITAGLRRKVNQVPQIQRKNFSPARESIHRWQAFFDREEGGMKGAPKFPMPVQHEFLLRYYHHTHEEDYKNFVIHSLLKMAKGGIYDQLGGGFARYSTDSKWKVPHFEKMLYDNAQMVRLYTEAWQLTKEEYLKDIVFETLGFILSELTSPEGGFYSALDADSEGEEGKFYTWTKAEIERLLGDHAAVFMEHYGIDKEAYWEEGKNILLRVREAQNEEVAKLLHHSKMILLQERSKRIRPGLDDKILTSWNGLMCTALLFAGEVFQQGSWVEAGRKNLDLMVTALRDNQGKLFHRYKNGTAGIPGFLEDYSSLIQACLAFPVIKDEKYLHIAHELIEIAIHDFYDHNSSLFYFISGKDPSVIARKTETADNVIPSSNSVMAGNLLRIGLLFEESRYIEMAEKMVSVMGDNMNQSLPSYSNWGIAGIDLSEPFYTLVITGKDAEKNIAELRKHYLPNVLITGRPEGSRLPLFLNLAVTEENRLYLCTRSECLPPAASIAETLANLKH
ncbi:MAG: thioredoxin domain-containing protein [Bacteroidales bacterium]